MTVKAILVRDVICDNCGETLRSTEPGPAKARHQAQEAGWVSTPRRGTMHDSHYKPARDLCSICKLIEAA